MHEGFFPTSVRVRYAETDQMGVVHHAVYPVWFELGRSGLSRACGMPYAEWERQGIYLMVAELSCRYRRPALYDEEILVWTRVKEVASRRVVFEYRVERTDGTLLVEGETRHLVVERASGRPVVIPEHLRATLLGTPSS